MPSKPKAKPKRKAGLSQKQRFIEAARKAESDETGGAFERLFRKIVPAKKGKGNPRGGKDGGAYDS